MSEPKKYTQNEAIHWMLDHPRREMVLCSVPLSYSYRYYGGQFWEKESGDDAWEPQCIECVKILSNYYVKMEYDAWQKNLERERKINEQMRNTTPEEREAHEKKMSDLQSEVLDGLLYNIRKPLDPDDAIATIKDIKRLIREEMLK